MAMKATLEEVERLAAKLTVEEQLKLVAHIAEWLGQRTEDEEEWKRREYIARAKAWLAECDKVAKQIKGKFDSAKDLREIREERMSRF